MGNCLHPRGDTLSHTSQAKLITLSYPSSLYRPLSLIILLYSTIFTHLPSPPSWGLQEARQCTPQPVYPAMVSPESKTQPGAYLMLKEGLQAKC